MIVVNLVIGAYSSLFTQDGNVWYGEIQWQEPLRSVKVLSGGRGRPPVIELSNIRSQVILRERVAA